MASLFKSLGKLLDPLHLFGGEAAPAPAQNPILAPAPVVPVVTPPTPIPLPDEEAIASAKRRSIAGQMQRSGRQSTLLTNDTGTNDLLG